tara:strand:+ start:172 stop:747 length:576 start_codon:yes stop_codon:yes gene_type:complete
VSRRRLIIGAAALTTGTISGAFIAGPAAAAGGGGIVQAALRHPGNVRKLALHSVNEGGSVAVEYWADGHYRSDALQAISHLMRDRRSLEVGAISPKLVDLLYILHSRLDTREPIEIVCGYRSPKTNAKLAKASKGVAKNSYHMRGMAADIRVKDRSARQIYKLAQALGVGGVGYYGKSGFVHVDVGPPRSW